MSDPISVMGLDGSLANFGIAIALVDPDAKKIIEIQNLVLSSTAKDSKAKRSDDDFGRFFQHWGMLYQQAELYNVKAMFGEIPSGAQDARAAFAFGGVTAILAGLRWHHPMTLVTPTEVKVATTGDKHADKEDVIEAVHKLYPTAPWIKGKRPNAMNIQDSAGLFLTNKNEHLADAIGTIIAGLKK